MSEPTDRKRELKREVRLQEMSAARKEVPISAAEALTFFELLEERVDEQGCDHSSRIAQHLAGELDLDPDDLFSWLEANGGSCDCEILSSVYPAWQDLQEGNS